LPALLLEAALNPRDEFSVVPPQAGTQFSLNWPTRATSKLAQDSSIQGTLTPDFEVLPRSSGNHYGITASGEPRKTLKF